MRLLGERLTRSISSRAPLNAVARRQLLKLGNSVARPLSRAQHYSGASAAHRPGDGIGTVDSVSYLGALRGCSPKQSQHQLLSKKAELKRLPSLCLADSMAAETSPANTEGLDNEPEKISYRVLTLVIIQQEGRVLLGKKKRGFGEGYFNGFGGKVEEGETVEEAAARELQEESGVTAIGMEKRGILIFHFDDKPQPWEVHVFHANEFVGEPCETEEMAPTWFAIQDIPYHNMWADDPLWYPEFLKGHLFRGEFFFKDTHVMHSHALRVVDSL